MASSLRHVNLASSQAIHNLIRDGVAEVSKNIPFNEKEGVIPYAPVARRQVAARRLVDVLVECAKYEKDFDDFFLTAGQSLGIFAMWSLVAGAQMHYVPPGSSFDDLVVSNTINTVYTSMGWARGQEYDTIKAWDPSSRNNI
jgi:hypothetical protein